MDFEKFVESRRDAEHDSAVDVVAKNLVALGSSEKGAELAMREARPSAPSDELRQNLVALGLSEPAAALVIPDAPATVEDRVAANLRELAS